MVAVAMLVRQRDLSSLLKPLLFIAFPFRVPGRQLLPMLVRIRRQPTVHESATTLQACALRQ